MYLGDRADWIQTLIRCGRVTQRRYRGGTHNVQTCRLTLRSLWCMQVNRKQAAESPLLALREKVCPHQHAMATAMAAT